MIEKNEDVHVEPAPKVSIVITTWNRAPLLRKTLNSFVGQDYKDFEVVVTDDGMDQETPKLCHEEWPFPLRYYRVLRHYRGINRSPGPVVNFAVRQALGDIAIIQNAECLHVGNVISRLVEKVTPNNVVLAQTHHLAPNGTDLGVLRSHDIEKEGQALFFCGAIWVDWFYALRGMDEDFVYPCCEDNDFSHRLKAAGLEFVYLHDAIVQHQWHPTAGALLVDETNQSLKLLKKKMAAMRLGQIGWARNLGRPWGDLPYEK